MNKALALLAFCTLAAAGPGHAMDLGLGGARYQVRVDSIKSMRSAGTLRQQFDFSCGSAALATLLTHHYGRPVSEQFVFERMYATGNQAVIRRQGFSLLDMRRFLQTLGYRADGFQLPLARLAEARLPAIVLISTGGYQHFVVIKGIDQGRVLIGDPAAGTLALPLRRFEKMWVNRILFVIHGHPRQPAFNAAADWRAAPRVALSDALKRDSLDALTLPKHGPGDF